MRPALQRASCQNQQDFAIVKLNMSVFVLRVQLMLRVELWLWLQLWPLEHRTAMAANSCPDLLRIH